MHTIVRYYIRAAVGFLALGLIIGLVMIVRLEFLGIHPGRGWLTAHTHVLLVGFVFLMIMGVAQWMFPRPTKDDKRYSPALARAVFWFMCGSVLVRTAGEVATALGAVYWPRWFIVPGAAGEVMGILTFFYNMRSRIRPVGSRLREAAGERF